MVGQYEHYKRRMAFVWLIYDCTRKTEKIMAEIFYHGSSRLFTKFNLDFALEGTGKVKFGFGIYVTSNFASAANYSKTPDGGADERHYVYTLEVIGKTKSNYISYVEPVNPLIVRKAQEKLQGEIPPAYAANGKLFRKYIGIRLSHAEAEWGKLSQVTDPGKAKLQVGIEEEKAASMLLLQIGVKMIEWPYSWRAGETRFNRAILKAENIRILKIEEVRLDEKGKYIEGSNTLVKDMGTNPHSLAPLIRAHYPEYWGMKEYPADKCVTIHKLDEEWGIFCNFARTPLVVQGIRFNTAEHLFQVLKFKEAECVWDVYNAPNPKMPAKKLETLHRRPDWGMIFIDVMKFCLMTKYEQSKEFREKLDETSGMYIVEDQSTFKKPADAWGVKLERPADGKLPQKYVGPNILGRLLMELRDRGTLEYALPDDILDGLACIKVSQP